MSNSGGGELRWKIVVEASGDQLRIVKQELIGFRQAIQQSGNDMAIFSKMKAEPIREVAGRLAESGAAAATAGQKFGAFGNQLRTMLEPAKAADPALRNIGANFEALQKSANSLGGRIRSTIGTIADQGVAFGVAATSAFVLINSIDNLIKVNLANQRIQVQADRLNNTAVAAELRLEKARSSGKLSAEQLATATEKVDIMRRRASASAAIAEHSEADLAKVYLGFVTQAIPLTAAFAGSMAQFLDHMHLRVSDITKGIKGLAVSFASVLGDIPNLAKAASAKLTSSPVTIVTKVAAGAAAPTAQTAATVGATAATMALARAESVLQLNNVSLAGSTSILTTAEAINALATGKLTQAKLTQLLVDKGVPPTLAASTAATIANSVAKAGAIGPTIGLSVATRALNAAMNANPIWFILAAVIGAIGFAAAAFATNLWGIRDAIGGVGKMLGDILPGAREFLNAIQSTVDWLAKMSGLVSDTAETSKNDAVFGSFTKSASEVSASAEGMSDSVSGSTATMAANTEVNFGQIKRDWMDARAELAKTGDLKKMEDVPDSIRTAWAQKIPAMKNVMIAAVNDIALKSGEKIVSLKDFVAREIGVLEKSTKGGTSGSREDQQLLDRLKHMPAELQLVRTATGDYAITRGTANAVDQDAVQTYKDLSIANKANTSDHNQITGSLKMEDEAAKSVLMTNKELTLVYQTDFLQMAKNNIAAMSVAFKEFDENQAAVAQQADIIWPSIAAQIGDNVTPDAIDNMVAKIKKFGEENGLGTDLVEKLINKTKEYGQLNFDPLLAGIEEADKGYQKTHDDIVKVIEKNKELMKLSTNNGIVIPPGGAKTPENADQVFKNQQMNVPDTTGVTAADDSFSKLILTIQQYRDTMGDASKAAKNLTQDEFDSVVADQAYIASHTNVNSILLDTRENTIRLGQARQEGIDKVTESTNATELKIASDQAELDKLHEVNGEFDTHNGLLKDNIENNLLVQEANLGSADAIDQVSKNLNDALAASDKYAQITRDVAQALFDAAKETGGLTTEQNQLKDIIDGTTTATNGEIESIINKIAAMQQLALVHGTVGATALQMSAAVVSGHAAGDAAIAKTATDAAAEAAQIERMEQVLIDKGVNVVALLHKLNQEASVQNLTLISAAAFGSPTAKVQLNSELQQAAKKQSDAASKASKDQQKQKIDEKKIREQAVQSALKEVEAYSSVIKKNIEETKSIREMALEFGVAESALKKFNKQMTEFGTATNKAQISLLKLTLTQAENLKYLHSQTQATKDLLNAQIEGAAAARDFEKNTRMDAIANKEELKQLEAVAKELGISLPASVKPTIENMHLLIEASYGSASALEDLKKSFQETSKIAEFFGSEIDDAKSAIREGHFSDFVKRELLFFQGADTFTGKVQLRIEAQVQLEDIGEQLKKQMALINMNPELFNQTMNDEDLKGGVRRTIESISQAVGTDPKLKEQWQPIVTELQKVLSSPDASQAIIEFSKKFPDFLGPALSGVDLMVQGLDTTINNTLKDDGGEAAKVLKDGLKDVDSHADKLEKTLLKAAKAMNSAAKSAGDFGNLLGDMLGDEDKMAAGTLQVWHNTAETRREAQKLTDVLTAGTGTGSASGKDTNPQKTLEWDKTNPFKVQRTKGGPMQIVRDMVAEAMKIPPVVKDIETQVTTSTGIMAGNFTATGTAALGIGTNATTAAAEVGTAKDTTSTNMTALETDVQAAATSIGAAWKATVDAIQLGNDWVQEHIVTPLTTFDWIGAIAGIGTWGQETADTIGAGVLDAVGWVNTNIITPLTTFDWAGGISTIAGWGQIFVDTIGQGVLDATGWINTNIITPITGYDWAGGISTIAGWGQTFVDTIGQGVLDATGWINTNIITPVTGYDWKGAIDTISAWGQQTVDVLGGLITDATGWIDTNIITPVTGYDWKTNISAISSWGTDTLTTIADGITGVEEWVKTNISSPIAGASSSFTSGISAISSWGTSILTTIKGGVTGVAEWVKTNVAKPITDAGASFTSGIETIKSWGTGIFDAIGKSLSQESVNKWIQDNIVSKITSFDWAAAWQATLDFLNPFKGADAGKPDNKDKPKTDGKSTKITTPTIESGAGGWDAWKKTAQDAMIAVEKTATGFASTIQSYFAGTIRIAVGVAGTSMTTLKTGWGTEMKSIEKTATGFASTIESYFRLAISNGIFAAQTSLTTFKTTAASDMKSMESTTKGFATTEATYFKANITLAVNVAKTAITTMKTTSASDMKSMESTTKGFASTEASWLSTGASSVKKSADTARASITTMRTTGASDMKSMESTAKTFAGNLKTDFATTIKKAADDASAAIKAVGDALDKIKGKKATVTIDVKLNNSTGLPDSSLGNLHFMPFGKVNIPTGIGMFGAGLTSPSEFSTGESRSGVTISGQNNLNINVPKLPDLKLGGNLPRLPQNIAGCIIKSIVHHLPLKIDSPLIIDGKEIGRVIREHSLEFIDSEL